MSWKNEAFQNFKLYAVTALTGFQENDLGKIEAAYRGGADIVQLRSKSLSDQELLRAAFKIKAVAEKYKKLFFVNDRADIALAADADGVHLGQEDLPVEMVRALAVRSGKKIWIGKSTHNLEQGKAAEIEKADYIGVGPVFETPTKPHYQAAGLEYVRQAAAALKVPFVAIGGIDQDNLHKVMEAGATRVAVVRAIFNAPDSERISKQLKEILAGGIHA